MEIWMAHSLMRIQSSFWTAQCHHFQQQRYRCSATASSLFWASMSETLFAFVLSDLLLSERLRYWNVAVFLFWLLAYFPETGEGVDKEDVNAGRPSSRMCTPVVYHHRSASTPCKSLVPSRLSQTPENHTSTPTFGISESVAVYMTTILPAIRSTDRCDSGFLSTILQHKLGILFENWKFVASKSILSTNLLYMGQPTTTE